MSDATKPEIISIHPDLWVYESLHIGFDEEEIPEVVEYRSFGERVQRKSDMPLKLERGHLFSLHEKTISTEGMAEFLSEHEDCEVVYIDDHPMYGYNKWNKPEGKWVEAHAKIVGWKDIAEGDFQKYLDHRVQAREFFEAPIRKAVKEVLENRPKQTTGSSILRLFGIKPNK